MIYKICYWDEAAKVQKERDATPAEAQEIEFRRANPEPFVPHAPTKSELLAQLNALQIQINSLP
jgi:hypothetical protein